jgi:hypothetical protein
MNTLVAMLNGVKSESRKRSVLNTRYPERNWIEKPLVALNDVSLMKSRP